MPSKTSSSKSYQISKFTLKCIEPGMVSVLIGKRHSGKGFFMRHLIEQLHSQYSVVIVFSGSELEDPFYTKFVAPCFIYDSFDQDALRRVIHEQRLWVTEHGINRNTSMCIILDDIMDENLSKNKELRSLFYNGRHYGISLFLCLQYAISISPAMRTNIDFVFLFNESIPTNRANLYKYFVGVCGSLKEFENLFRQLTQNYQLMVVRLSRVESDNVDTNIFWYKAKPTKSFKAGAIETWQFYNSYSIQNNKKKSKLVKQIHM